MPPHPAMRARPASRSASWAALPENPISVRSSSVKLVRTVTARIIGFEAEEFAASVAAFSIFMPAGGVDGQHADLQLGGFSDGMSDGVGNVVEFEVEKNFTAGSHQVANDLGPLGRKQLLTDFIYMG